ncbi:hypothetical protein [Gordonia neofelifaecis]|uniref:DUF1214 domain-containing protein n=1 Tax=Gordonia neofelifaecis NRRL B-59395 TaxID=644548 RepID=F1YIA4_9ACTN|nr:hypothetical protein [Gordonia neofelifaecis]EGD55658.1 hypothetical protein SCNU_08093 [Gordonia neofelifaecis NRRL B-59395]
MLTDDFATSLAEAEKLISTAPHIRTPQDLHDGYQYLAACIQAVLHNEWSTELAAPFFIHGAGPFTKQGLDNPDTMYFNTDISDDAEYLVVGKRGTTADLSFQLLAGSHTDSEVPASVAAFDDRDLDIDEDGNFTLRLGPDPTPAPGYLPLPKGTTMLLVREVYSDWTEQRGQIRVERLDTAGQPLPALTAERAEKHFDKAGRDLIMRIKTWLQFPEWFYLNLPVNTLTEPRITPGGLTTQYSSVGHYDLAADEAMIITVPESDAPYQGLQLGSLWYISLDYINRQTSLNTTQSQTDPDGMIRIVVSEQNPGIVNWLDTIGHARGYLQFRWQRLSRPLTEADGPTCEIVKISEVPGKLPYYADNQITPDAFAERIADRKAGFSNRMLG